jgi:quaternary ammonium compound-resistance protein SugE
VSPWWLLLFAGLLEVVWAVALKYADGFTRFWPSVVVLVTLAGSLVLMSRAARALPIGTAYAIWVGIGALGAALCGIVLFREPVTLARAAFLMLLLGAVLGLKLTAPAHG